MKPVLLTMPRYVATLAAVRSLGRVGVPVTIAGDDLFAPARWSHYASRVVTCPPVQRAPEFLDWLLTFGDREQRHVLAASCDDVAFLIAENAVELEKRFDLYSPSVATLVRLLDKRALAAACESVGLGFASSWFPTGELDLPRIALEATFPVILKARTQVRRVDKSNGIVVQAPAELLDGYRRFGAHHRYEAGMSRHFGEVSQPLVQRYFPEGAARVYSITGFVDRGGSLLTARAAVKVFQRTRPIGLGVCYEAAEMDATLLEGVERLCREVGYFGVFEAEVVRTPEQAMLIDFNPRFFGQMAFDEARGQPLARLFYRAACGNEAALRALAAQSRAAAAGATIYANRFTFELLLWMERLEGSMSTLERSRWRSWYSRNRLTSADPSADRRDRLAGHLLSAHELWASLREVPNGSAHGSRAGSFRG